MARIVTMNVIPASAARNLNMYATIYGESSQTVTEQGKNLFDWKNSKVVDIDIVEQPTFGTIIDGVYTNQESFYNLGTYLTLPENTIIAGNTYIVSFYVLSPYTQVIIFGIRNTAGTSVTATKTVQENTLTYMTLKVTAPLEREYYQYIQLQGTSTINYNNINTVFTDIQLELGSTATEYEPFVPNSPSPDYPSPISKVSSVKVSGIDYPAPQDLYSLPDGTRDWYDFLTGEGESPIGINVFNGTETIVADTEGTNTYCFYAELPNGACWGASPAYCSHFKRLGGVDVDEEGFTGDDTSNKVYFRVKKQRLAGDTANDFKNFLAAQDTAEMPVTVIYKKATSTAITGTPVDFPELPYYAIGGGNKKVGISVK